MFSDANMLGSVLSISGYLLGDPEESIKPLPLEHLESVMRNELGTALTGIGVSKVMLKDGVVLIPCVKAGRKYIIQIALKNSLSAKDLAGHGWGISDRFAVKILPEDYKEPAPARSVSELLEELSDKDHPGIREAAAKALGELGDKEALRPLLEKLSDKDLRVHTAAAKALGELGDKRAVEPLLEELSGWYPDICRTAETALGKIGVTEKQLADGYMRALSSVHDNAWANAARCLGELGYKEAVEPLLEGLSDRRPSIRRAAAEALGELGDKRAVKPLLERLSDEDLGIYEAAASALVKINDPGSVWPYLEQWISYYILMQAEGRGSISSGKSLLITGIADSFNPLSELKIRTGKPERVANSIDEVCKILEQVIRTRLYPAGLDMTANKPTEFDVTCDFKKLEHFIREEVAQQGQNETGEPPHAFKAVSGFRASLLAGGISIASAAIGAVEYLAQGDVTGITVAAVLVGSYFTWAAARYFLVGSAAYKAVESYYSQNPDPENYPETDGMPRPEQVRRREIAESDGYRHPAFKDLSFKAQRLVALHESFESHFWGMAAMAPVVSTLLLTGCAEITGPKGGAIAAFIVNHPFLFGGLILSVITAAVIRSRYFRMSLYLSWLRRPHDLVTSRQGAWRLKGLGDRRAVGPLVEELSSKVWYIRVSAAEILEELGDKRAIEPLMELSNDPSWAVYDAAGRALDRLGVAKTRMIDWHLAALSSENRLVRGDAAETLKRSGVTRSQLVDGYIKALSCPDKGGREEAVRALEELGDNRAVEPLLEKLPYFDASGLRIVLKALGKLTRGRVFEAVSTRLLAGKNTLCEAAARALGQLGDKRAVGPLIIISLDEERSVREAAVEALGKLGDKRAVGPLLKMLSDGFSRITVRALEELGVSRTRMAGAYDEFITALLSGDPPDRRIAAEILGELGDKRAIGPLLEKLSDEEKPVRRAAAESLKKLGAAETQMPDGYIKALSSSDETVCMEAAEALGRLGAKRAVGPLIERLLIRRKGDSRAVVEALGWLGAKRAVGPLLNKLSDPDPGVRQAVVEALGEFGDKRAVEPLLEKLSDLDPGVRRAAAESLKRSGADKTQMVDGYIKALSSSNKFVCMEAVQALGRLGDERAFEPLVGRLLDWHHGVSGAAAEALGKLGNMWAVEPLLWRLSDRDPGVRAAVAEALGKLGDKRAVEPLLGKLSDRSPAVYRAAARALKRINDPASVWPHVKDWIDYYITEASGTAMVDSGRRRNIEAIASVFGSLSRVRISTQNGERVADHVSEINSILEQVITVNSYSGKRYMEEKEQGMGADKRVIISAETPEPMDSSAGFAVICDLKELKRLIQERLGKQHPGKGNEPPHAFKAVSGYRASFLTGGMSIAGAAMGAVEYVAQGDVTGITAAAVLVGAYFAWAAARYFLVGSAAYKAVESYYSQNPDPENYPETDGMPRPEQMRRMGIAESDGYRHPAFEDFPFKAQRLIAFHESFKSHFWGMAAMAPLVYLLSARVDKFAASIKRVPKSYFASVFGWFSGAAAGGVVLWLVFDYLIYYRDISGDDDSELFIMAVAPILGSSAGAFVLGSVLGVRAVRLVLRLCAPVERFARKYRAADEEAKTGRQYKASLYPKAYDKAVSGNPSDIRALVSLLYRDASLRTRLADALGPMGEENFLLNYYLAGYLVERLEQNPEAEVLSQLKKREYKRLGGVLSGLMRETGLNIAHITEVLDQAIGVEYYPSHVRGEERALESSYVTIPGRLVISCDFKRLERIEQIIKEELEKQDQDESNGSPYASEAASDPGAPLPEEAVPDPETVTPVEVTQLFEIVEAAINNRRTRLVNAGNELIVYLIEEGAVSSGTPAINRENSTAEIKSRMERVLAAVDELRGPSDEEGTGETDLPDNVISAAADLRENMDILETDSVTAALITLARSAGRRDQNLIIGLETDWIPGYERGGMQHSAINPLIREIESLGDTLRSMGLDNVRVVHTGSNELADELVKEAEETSTELSNVVVLASNNTINSERFDRLRSTRQEKRAFLAGIDTRELDKAGSSDSRVNIIHMIEMISITLELAMGKAAPDLPFIARYDRELRIVIFLPEAEPLKYEELKQLYRMRKLALQAA